MRYCRHLRTTDGPDIPRRYDLYRSQVCRDCGAWRTMTYGIPAGDISEWRSDPIDDAVKEDEDL